jgi:hypothetical protein
VPSRFGWEPVSETLWTCDAGFIDKKDRASPWTAHVYRNVRTGQGWTETKKGFDTASAAMAWVENHAEV